MDFGSIVTLTGFYLVVMLAAGWAVQIIVRAENKASKTDIDDAINEISTKLRKGR